MRKTRGALRDEARGKRGKGGRNDVDPLCTPDLPGILNVFCYNM